MLKLKEKKYYLKLFTFKLKYFAIVFYIFDWFDIWRVQHQAEQVKFMLKLCMIFQTVYCLRSWFEQFVYEKFNRKLLFILSKFLRSAWHIFS